MHEQPESDILLQQQPQANLSNGFDFTRTRTIGCFSVSAGASFLGSICFLLFDWKISIIICSFDIIHPSSQSCETSTSARTSTVAVADGPKH